MALLVPAAAPGPGFEDRSARSGIGFVLRNAASPEKHLIETMPGGVAVFDYDNDGYPDIFFTNGASSPPGKDGPSPQPSLPQPGRRTFEDVTAKPALAASGYNIGVAAGDFDNDGMRTSSSPASTGTLFTIGATARSRT